MEDRSTQAAPADTPLAVSPETPEDVAILYSWANLHGAKYRDFSASRREYRAQQRARAAEQQRQAELAAAREAEEKAEREMRAAQLALEESQKAEEEARRAEEEIRRAELEARHPAEASAASGERARYEAELKARVEEARQRAQAAIREAEERAGQDKQEAQRREALAEGLRLRAETAHNEMLMARKRAEEQAARYAEFDQQYRAELARGEQLLPGELADPYYYTGQVDPAYFASTPGVRTAQATRVSTERKAYVYPVHPGSDEHYSGSARAYLPRTTFLPSTALDSSQLPPLAEERFERAQPAEQQRMRGAALQGSGSEASLNDSYYDGVSPSRMFIPQTENGAASAANRDMVIRPAHHSGSSDPGKPADFAPIRSFIPAPDRPAPSGEFRLPPLRDTPKNGSVAADEPLKTERVAPAGVSARETMWRSVDHRAEANRRRRNAGVDEHARTTRQPRPSEELWTEPQHIRQEVGAPPPPAWLSGERAGAAMGSDERPFPSMYPPAESEIPRLEPPAELAPIGAETRFDSEASAEKNSAERNEDWRVSAMAPEVSVAGQGTAETAAHAELTGRGTQGAIRTPSTSASPLTSPSPYVLPVQVSAVDRLDSTEPDTLLQSRERVALRWYALEGLMGPDALEHGRPGPQQAHSNVLAVLSLSGGSGKTSIVATLGRALSSLGEKVLLADTNSHGLLPYYFGARDLRADTVRTFTPPAGNSDAPVMMLHCEAEGLGHDEVGQERLIGQLNEHGKDMDRTLLDIGAPSLWVVRRLAVSAPRILVPVTPDMNSVLGAQALERTLANLVDWEGRPVKPYYVLNQFDPTLPLHLDIREVFRQFLGERLLSWILHRAPAVAEALAEGMTVIDYAPDAPVTEDYMNLAHWLRNLAAPALIAPASTRARWSER